MPQARVRQCTLRPKVATVLLGEGPSMSRSGPPGRPACRPDAAAGIGLQNGLGALVEGSRVNAKARRSTTTAAAAPKRTHCQTAKFATG
jgi:hypothetical protein